MGANHVRILQNWSPCNVWDEVPLINPKFSRQRRISEELVNDEHHSSSLKFSRLGLLSKISWIAEVNGTCYSTSDLMFIQVARANNLATIRG